MCAAATVSAAYLVGMSNGPVVVDVGWLVSVHVYCVCWLGQGARSLDFVANGVEMIVAQTKAERNPTSCQLDATQQHCDHVSPRPFVNLPSAKTICFFSSAIISGSQPGKQRHYHIGDLFIDYRRPAGCCSQ